VIALHQTQVPCFLRAHTDGKPLYSLNVTVGKPLTFDRERIIEYLRIQRGLNSSPSHTCIHRR